MTRAYGENMQTDLGRDHPSVCDFCSGPPAWRYPAETFVAHPGEPLPIHSLDDWLACDECAALSERNEWDALARRGLLNPAFAAARAAGLLSEEEAIAQIRPLHQLFRQHRRGRVRCEPEAK